LDAEEELATNLL